MKNNTNNKHQTKQYNKRNKNKIIKNKDKTKNKNINVKKQLVVYIDI